MAMKRNIFNEVVFECDECGEELETDCRDFDAALQQLRDSGWKASRLRIAGGDWREWNHYCLVCQREGKWE